MTTENGATAGDVENVNSEVETQTSQGGGDNANTEAEKWKQEIATRDKKIAELLKADKRLKEIEQQREAEKLAQKTTEEQMEHYRREVEDMRREQVFSRELSALGVSVEEANKILKAGTAEEQASALKQLILSQTERAATSSVEELKQKMLNEATKTVPDTDKNITEDPFIASMRKGSGV